MRNWNLSDDDRTEPRKSTGKFNPYKPPVLARNESRAIVQPTRRPKPAIILIVFSLFSAAFIGFLFFQEVVVGTLSTIIFVPAALRYSILFYNGKLPTYSTQVESCFGSLLISIAIWLALIPTFVMTCTGGAIGAAVFIQAQPRSGLEPFFSTMAGLLTFVVTLCVAIYLFRLSLRLGE